MEKQGTRPGWHPQCRERVGRPGLRDHVQEEQWQRASQSLAYCRQLLGLPWAMLSVHCPGNPGCQAMMTRDEFFQKPGPCLASASPLPEQMLIMKCKHQHFPAA